MGNPVTINRNSCMLHGAVQTVKFIEGAVPVVHSTAGCGIQQYWGGSSLSGGSGSGAAGGAGLPSTNVIERQVVFGGTSRLREQLKNTVKVKDGDFYVVLSGCTTELVGDDIPAMTKELQEQKFKAAHISTPGFKGYVHEGYTATIKGLLQQWDKISAGPSPEKNNRLVNVFGIIPEQDVYWRGNLAGVAEGIRSIGLDANVIFGQPDGRKQWSSITGAALNLSFSVHGLEICQWLEEQYGIPYLSFDAYPVGARQTAQVLREAAHALQLDEAVVEERLRQQRLEEQLNLTQILDIYCRYDFQRRTALAGDSGVILGIAGFLLDTLGLPPVKVIATDPLKPDVQAKLSSQWKSLLPGADLIFESDTVRIGEILQEGGIELILGSTIEAATARANNIPLVPIAFPVADRIVLQKGYAGLRGALTLLEDIGNAILSHESDTWNQEGATSR